MAPLSFIGVFKPRREPLSGPMLFAPDRTVRPVTQPPPHEAPEGPRDSEFNERPARMPIATRFNMADIQAVQNDDFLIDLRAPEALADVNEGIQIADQNRPNLERGNATTYGSLHTLTPAQYETEYLY